MKSNRRVRRLVHYIHAVIVTSLLIGAGLAFVLAAAYALWAIGGGGDVLSW